MSSPLSGIKVVDFSRILAGPFASQLLGDLGADVIKVESERGDESRAYGWVDEHGVAGKRIPDLCSPVFASFNRNKRSITLDLKTPEGNKVAMQLAKRSDVLLHNFRTGVMERLGLDYGSVRLQNPAIIYCSVSGFGSSGPSESVAANDLISQAASGLLSFTGYPGEPPARVPVGIGDLTAGLYATMGVLAGLLQRERHGAPGQQVETSLLEAVLSLISFNLTQHLVTGWIPQPQGTQNNVGQPNQVFRVRDGWVAVAATSDAMWQKFCLGIGQADTLGVDPRFTLLSDRYANREELVRQVSDLLSEMTLEECVGGLNAAQVPCSKVRSLDEVASDPQLQVLGAVAQVSYRGKSIPVVNTALHFSETPPSIRLGPPVLSEHTQEILSELGYQPAEIKDLAEQGALGTTIGQSASEAPTPPTIA